MMDKPLDLDNVDEAYVRLAAYGINRESSIDDIDKCTFAIMKRHDIRDAREELDAVRTLREVPNRLLIDFLSFRGDSPEQQDPAEVIIKLLGDLPRRQEFLQANGLSPEQLAQPLADAAISKLEQELASISNAVPDIRFGHQPEIDNLIRELL